MPSLSLTFVHELPDGDLCVVEHERSVDQFSPRFDEPAAAKCPGCDHLYSLAECRDLDASWDRRLDDEVNRGAPVARACRTLITAEAH